MAPKSDNVQGIVLNFVNESDVATNEELCRIKQENSVLRKTNSVLRKKLRKLKKLARARKAAPAQLSYLSLKGQRRFLMVLESLGACDHVKFITTKKLKKLKTRKMNVCKNQAVCVKKLVAKIKNYEKKKKWNKKKIEKIVNELQKSEVAYAAKPSQILLIKKYLGDNKQIQIADRAKVDPHVILMMRSDAKEHRMMLV
ncbi:hypothetical protein QQ045_002597 [Rhodiola kirilowii]